MTKKDFRAVYLPYCLEKLGDGNWVVLNREYNPVGFNTKEHIDHSQYPVAVRLGKLTIGKLKKLSYTGEVEGDRVHLYNDDTNPIKSAANMRKYYEKLTILSTISFEQ